MEESLRTWPHRHSSVRHLIIQERHHEGALTSLINTAHPPIIGSVS